MARAAARLIITVLLCASGECADLPEASGHGDIVLPWEEPVSLPGNVEDSPIPAEDAQNIVSNGESLGEVLPKCGSEFERSSDLCADSLKELPTGVNVVSDISVTEGDDASGSPVYVPGEEEDITNNQTAYQEEFDVSNRTVIIEDPSKDEDSLEVALMQHSYVTTDSNMATSTKQTEFGMQNDDPSNTVFFDMPIETIPDDSLDDDYDTVDEPAAENSSTSAFENQQNVITDEDHLEASGYGITQTDTDQISQQNIEGINAGEVMAPQSVHLEENSSIQHLTASESDSPRTEESSEEEEEEDEPIAVPEVVQVLRDGDVASNDDVEFDRPQGASLAFVFDFTGSMHDDLMQLKLGAERIMATMLERQDKPIYNYVLVPFHDPKIGPVTVTRDHEEFRKSLQDIVVHGGTDCPEMAIGAIKLALEHSLPNSFIYVFTDASAKDYHLLPDVLKLIQKKQSQVTFVMTGDCGDSSLIGYKVYEKIAYTSSGQIYSLNKTDVEEVLHFVRESLQSRKVNLLSVVKPGPSTEEHRLNVDESLQEFTVAVSGRNPQIGVMNPRGKMVEGPPKLKPLLSLETVKVVNVNEPEPGQWMLKVSSDSEHSVRSTGLSDIDFNFGFSVVATTNMEETYHRPLKGAKNSVLVQPTHAEELHNITLLKLIDLKGNIFKEIPLNPVEEENGLYRGDTFIPPNDFFHLGVDGFGKDGYPLERISPTAITGQDPEPPVVNMKHHMTAWIGKPVRLRCRVESLIPFFVMWFKDGISTPLTGRKQYKQTSDIFWEIPNPGEMDEGNYTCYANNAKGSSKHGTWLSITGPAPEVEAVSRVSSGVNKTVSLSCKVKSPLRYNVTWTRVYPRQEAETLQSNEKTTLLPNGTLLIHNVNTDDEAWYSCIVRSKGGKNESATYLSVWEAVQVTVMPERVEFKDGGNILLRCRATGTPEPVIFWKKGSETLSQDSDRRLTLSKQPDGLDLYLENANREDAGEYYCIADNDDEMDEGVAVVSYLDAPRAVAERQSMVTGVGEDAILRCIVSGSPTPILRWLKNEEDVIISPKYQVFEDGSLVIRNTQTSDSGTYTCIAENHAGRGKDSIAVMVGMQPQMVQIPQNTEIEIMKNGSVPCIATGQPAPLVTWERTDGGHQNRSRIFSTETGNLLFTFAEIEDGGAYRCNVQNTLGRRVFDVNVTITGIVKPILGSKNSNHAGTTVKRGMLIELPCQVLLSNPPPTVTWYKDGEVLGQEQMAWEGISLQANNSLIIPYTTQEHEGTYECVVSNIGGSASQSTTLHVLELPVFLSSGTVTYKSRVGDKIVLPCPALGDPEPIITWKKDGMPLLSSPTVYKNPEDNNLVINDATVGDSGTYACTAANSAGEARKFMVLFVQEPPHILSEADTVDAIEGQAVTITCNVKAVPNPIIHWYKDGTPLESYGNGIIYLNNNASIRFVAHVSTSGAYICEAENEAGSDRKEMMLKVLVPPTIYPPDDEFYTVNTSQSLKLSCLVSGYPQPNIRWEHNGVLLDNTSNIKADSNGTLFLDNIQSRMAGVYVCDAENAAGITQKVFYVLVHVQPRIEVEFPTHVKLMEGDDFSLPCSARGYPSPEISWRKDGKSIFGNQTENLTVLEDGTLVISAASLETTGIYTCSAENAEGDDTKHFLVEVLVPPSMSVMEDSKIEVIEGDSVVITCPAMPAIPPPVIHWLKDGKSLDLKLNERSDMPHFTLLDGGHSLKLEEASPQDKGTYSCIATNLAGQTDAQFKLDVLLAPYFDEFDNYKQDFTVVAGAEVKLECDVGGNPPPRISWRRNNLPVTPHTAPGVMLSPDKRILLIPKVKTMNAGRYQCSATNKAGRMDRDFHITVLVPPELEGPGQETHEVVKGEPLLLQCPISGYPEPSIKWMKNGLDLPNHFGGNYILSEDQKILEISHIDQYDAGIYTCIGTNDAASKKKNFSVTVLEPPTILQDKEVENYKVRAGEGISLICKVQGSPIPDVKWLHNGHLVEGKEMTSDLSNSLEGKYFVEEHVLTLHNVDVQDGGKYTCLASSVAGVAEKSYRVRILVAPKLAEYRQGSKTIESLEGLPVMLKCPVVGDPMPNIHWMKDSQPLDNQMEANGQMLHIKNIRKEDAGNYTCIAQNNAGNISQSFQLDILEPPVMADSQEPSSFQVVANEDLTLRCNVTGRPPPNVLWFKGASPITPERWPQAKFLDHNRTLIIPQVSLKLSGRYSCLASNMAGDRELVFNVEVQEPPDIPSDLPEFSEHPVLLHRRLVLKCPITGSPLPKITWYKDGVPVHKELGSNVHISSDGKQLHLMHAQVRNSGNYSCLAENSAGSKELHFGVHVTVPAEWSTWTSWSECSVTCGQGEQIRVRVCGEDVEEFVEESYCPGEAEQVQACHIAECPIDGSWNEWSEWTSCSESCGHATRRRYRKCDNPAPAFGGKPCLGSDAQQEYCKQPPCPVNGNWSGWSEWSECSTTCGNGIKHRTRKCNNPPPAFGGKICFGLDLDLQDCNPHKCPVNGNWANWGEWSSCSVTCGQGSKRRFRTCTNPAPRFKGANCKGENLQIEKCRARSCGDVPLQASLTVKGKLNGEDLNEKVIAANISDLGPKRTVSATLKNILKQQAGWFPYLTFLLPPVSWNAAYELDEANNGFSLTHGNFKQQSLIEFASGEELVVRHTGKGIDESGALLVEIEVDGEVPIVQPEASVVVEPYEEDYVQTGPSTLYTSSENAFNINGRKLPYTWNNTVMYDTYQGTMPYLVEKLQTRDIDLDYDPGLQQMTYIMSTAIKKKYDSDKCPEGFVRDEEHLHCRDIDECEDRQTNRCHFTQICENVVGTYRCYCRPGFKSTRIGKRCLDVNECLENPTMCSHQCRNTKGSFKCICPRGMILLEDGRTCTSMWANTEDQYMNPEIWPQLHQHALRSGGRRSHSYDVAPYQDIDYRITQQGHTQPWSCPEGFEALSGVCQDIDECRSLPNVCNIEQICLNTKGSYRCLETPCPTGYERDLESRNCVMFCDEPGVICKEGALLTQTISYVVLTLDSREVQPYQDLMQLVVYGEDGRRLPRTRYRIVENETGKPFRVRIENQQGILYTLKSLKMGRLYRIAVLALSYDEYEHNVLYITKYIIFINLFDDTQYK